MVFIHLNLTSTIVLSAALLVSGCQTASKSMHSAINSETNYGTPAIKGNWLAYSISQDTKSQAVKAKNINSKNIYYTKEMAQLIH